MRLILKFLGSGKVNWSPTPIYTPNYAEDENAWIYELILNNNDPNFPKVLAPDWYPEGNPLYTSIKQGIDFANNYFSSPGYLSRFADQNHYRNYNNKLDSYAEIRKLYNADYGTDYNGDEVLKFDPKRSYINSGSTPALNLMFFGTNYGNRYYGLNAEYKGTVYWPKETSFITGAHEASHHAHGYSLDPEGFTQEELELMKQALPAEFEELYKTIDDSDYAWRRLGMLRYINNAIMQRKGINGLLDLDEDNEPITTNDRDIYLLDPKLHKLMEDRFWEMVLKDQNDLVQDEATLNFELHDSDPEELDAMRTELLAGLASEGIYDARFTKKDGTFNPVTKELLKRYMHTKSYQAFPRLINMYRNNLDALVDLLNMTYK